MPVEPTMFDSAVDSFQPDPQMQSGQFVKGILSRETASIKDSVSHPDQLSSTTSESLQSIQQAVDLVDKGSDFTKDERKVVSDAVDTVLQRIRQEYDRLLGVDNLDSIRQRKLLVAKYKILENYRDVNLPQMDETLASDVREVLDGTDRASLQSEMEERTITQSCWTELQTILTYERNLAEEKHKGSIGRFAEISLDRLATDRCFPPSASNLSPELIDLVISRNPEAIKIYLTSAIAGIMSTTLKYLVDYRNATTPIPYEEKASVLKAQAEVIADYQLFLHKLSSVSNS